MDGLMMDWLYDELDPSSSAKVAQHVDGCSRCSTEMAALRRTRAAFGGMSHPEPPAAISAILLHEAARRAPASAAATRRAAGDSLWQRLRAWLRPLAHHPAVTAMASLILVAGVAGALYVRKGWDIGAPHQLPDTAPGSATRAAAPPASPETPVFEDQGERAAVDSKGEGAERNGRFAAGPVPAQSSSRAAPPPDQTKSSAGDDRGDGFAAKLLDGEKEADLRQAEQAQAPEEKSRRKQAPAARAAETQAKNEAKKSIASQDPADEQVNRRGVDPAAADVVASEGRSESRRARNAVGGTAPAREPESAAPGGTPVTATDKADSDDSANASADQPRTQALSKSEQGWLAVQEQRLTSLVRGKRCREAAAVANDILDRNPAYYVRRIRDSKDVEPCRRHVGDEQKRRASRRVKAPTSGSKAGAGAAQKAKAAPARDEAAEKSAN